MSWLSLSLMQTRRTSVVLTTGRTSLLQLERRSSQRRLASGLPAVTARTRQQAASHQTSAAISSRAPASLRKRSEPGRGTAPTAASRPPPSALANARALLPSRSHSLSKNCRVCKLFRILIRLVIITQLHQYGDVRNFKYSFTRNNLLDFLKNIPNNREYSGLL